MGNQPLAFFPHEIHNKNYEKKTRLYSIHSLMISKFRIYSIKYHDRLNELNKVD